MVFAAQAANEYLGSGEEILNASGKCRELLISLTTVDEHFILKQEKTAVTIMENTQSNTLFITEKALAN